MEIINALRENVTVLCEAPDGTRYETPALAMAKTTIIHDNDREFTVVTQYRHNLSDERPVHQSVHVHSKIPAVWAESAVGGVGQAA